MNQCSKTILVTLAAGLTKIKTKCDGGQKVEMAPRDDAITLPLPQVPTPKKRADDALCVMREDTEEKLTKAMAKRNDKLISDNPREPGCMLTHLKVLDEWQEVELIAMTFDKWFDCVQNASRGMSG